MQMSIESIKGCSNRKVFLRGTDLGKNEYNFQQYSFTSVVAGSKGKHVLHRNLRIYLSFACGLQLQVFRRHQPHPVGVAEA